MSTSNPRHKKRYRVAQWATGNIGLRSMRAVIEHPQMELVGLFVYSPAKVGRDAGDLCGVDATGVVATNEIDDILAASPDCVLYMPDRPEYDVVCRLLESGINIVSTRTEFHHPGSLDPEVRDRIEAACQTGRASILSAGSSPGFATETLPFAFASMQRRLDCITKEESADMSSRNSPEMIFSGLGFGQDPATLSTSIQNVRNLGAAASMRMTMEALSLPLDDFTASVEFAVATSRVEIAAGTIEPGTVGARRSQVIGWRNGKARFRRLTTYYVTQEIEPAWDLHPTGWHFLIEGDTPMEVFISFPVAEADYADFSPRLTAHPPVNYVPYVCDAAPGMRTSAELPIVVANLAD